MRLRLQKWLYGYGIIILFSFGLGIFPLQGAIEVEAKDAAAVASLTEKTDLHPYIESLLERADEKFMEGEKSGDVEALQTFLVHSLNYQRNVCICGPDELARPPVVNFQNCIEELLIKDFDEKKIEKAIGIIHTGRPATPLCNPVGEVYKTSLSSDKVDNKEIESTLLKRAVTLREFAKRMPLYITYPKGGLQKRTAQEAAIYRKELSNPDHKFLHDVELSVKAIPDNLVGATYIITTLDGATVVMSVGGAQAVDTNNQGWQVWIGRLKDPEIAERFAKVYDYLRSGGFTLEL